MKRIICTLTAAVMAICLSAPAFAASSKVTVKNNISSSKPVTYTYDSDKEGETVTSIKSLMTKLNELTKNSLRTQTLTITSDSANGEPVSFKLRISMPAKTASTSKAAQATPSPDEYSALDYYNVKVTAENGSVLYNTVNETDDGSGEQVTYKDIPLGVLNSTSASDSETYNLTLSINRDITRAAVATAAKKLDWSIVSEPYTEIDETASPEPEATEATEAPQAEATPETQPSSSPVASPSPTAKVKSDKNGNYTLPKGEYTVGTDIDADRYTLTGNGLVNIYNSDGTLERTVALRTKNDKSSNGVTEYVINLSKGEKIDVEDEAALELYVAPTASPTPSPTPKATAASGSSSSSSSNSSSKSNPKTGDNTPIAGITVIGIAAFAGAVFITLRKKNR